MKKKKKRIVLLVINYFLIFLLGVFIFFSIKSFKINDEIESQIEEFKNSAIFNKEISNDTIKYYNVTRETLENKKAFYDEINLYPGTMGDILVNLESPFRIPIFSELQTLFFGGHAVISYGKEILEITGNFFRTDNIVKFAENDYITNSGIPRFVGLRVKNMAHEDYENLNKFYLEQLGKKYNYLYLFDTKNKFYCTDLISRGFESLNKGFHLNKNKGFVTVQDLVISEDTYIFMVKEIDKNGIVHIYYLE